MKKKRKPKLTKAEKELNESHMSTGEGRSELMGRWEKQVYTWVAASPKKVKEETG